MEIRSPAGPLFEGPPVLAVLRDEPTAAAVGRAVDASVATKSADSVRASGCGGLAPREPVERLTGRTVKAFISASTRRSTVSRSGPSSFIPRPVVADRPERRLALVLGP